MLFCHNLQQDLKFLTHNMQHVLLYLKKNSIFGIIEIGKIYRISISSRHGTIDDIESSNCMNHVVTIYNNHRRSSVFSNDVSVSGIYKSIDKSIIMSKHIDVDKHLRFPDINLLYKNNKTINIFFPKLFSLKEINNLVNITDFYALNFDSKITGTEGSVFEYFIDLKILGNSCDWIGTRMSTRYYLSSCTIASSQGCMEKDFSYTTARDFKDLDKPVWIGKSSARKSIAKLNSKKIATQISPIIIKSDISYELFIDLKRAINGYAVYKKSTFLLNYIDKQIFPTWLNIFENPFLDKGLSSNLFDNEGIATVSRKIINNGVLKTWLLDTYSANRLNMLNTGHSGGTYNWLISTKKKVIQSFDQILDLMYTGFLVTELFGDGVNIVTGDYSRGVCGFWIDHGKIKYPVHGVTISGNLLNMWNNMITLANDINSNNSIQCASILIDKVQISGF
ncbi:MAG: metallopeptidase TldD-related protein [Janthinobacterium lividum]|uniref:Metalloprotease PmbA n=1 Tax=Buchnera aphidicola (Cinara pseudotsugae) TaxID=2518978 RepID=A0A451DF25_9GAMM